MTESGPLNGCWTAVYRPNLSCSSLRGGSEMPICSQLSPVQAAGTSSPFTRDQPAAGTQGRADSLMSGVQQRMLQRSGLGYGGQGKG